MTGMAYIGRLREAKDDRAALTVVCAIADDPARPREAADAVSDWVRKGLIVERVPQEWVRANLFTANTYTQAPAAPTVIDHQAQVTEVLKVECAGPAIAPPSPPDAGGPPAFPREPFEDIRRSGACLCIRCCSERGENRRFFNGLNHPHGFRFACELCGNKRCPHHSDHTLACTRSNEPGQPGSVFA